MGNDCTNPPKPAELRDVARAGTARAEAHFRNSLYHDEHSRTMQDDDRFGEIGMLKTLGGGRIFRKRIVHKSAKGFAQAAETKAVRMKFDEKYFAKLYDYDCGACHSDEFFGDDGQDYFIDCYYEFLSSDLKKQIKDRKDSNDMFSEEELLSLSKSIITANAFLQANEMKHGDIRPEFILYDREADSWKLIENIRYPFYSLILKIETFQAEARGLLLWPKQIYTLAQSCIAFY
jgi:hypothetical protein